MDIGVTAAAFALLLPAELPDKTFVATLVLATRYRGGPVWLGVTAGFFVQTLLAVVAGGLIGLAPRRPVLALSAVLFAVGALVLLRGKESEQITEGARLAEEAPPTARRIALTSFAVLFAAEWGDISQLLTASLTARYDEPLSVFVGAWLALATVAALAVLAGRSLLRVVPLSLVRRIAGLLFAALSIVTAAEAAGAHL